MKYKEKNTKNAQNAKSNNPKKTLKAEKKARRKKKIKRVFLAIACLILAVCVGVGFAGYKMIATLQPAIDEETLESLAERNTAGLMTDSAVKNVLMLGVDSRKSDGTGLSDTIMLVSINSKTKTISLVSFLRDMQVDIPGHGKARINAACSWGGVPLAVETIEHNFGIKIDHYVLVTFEAVREIVNAMGGIYLPLTESEANEMKRYTGNSKKKSNRINLPSGDSVLMNGHEALIYSRIRKQDSDWERTSRQRTLLNALADKAKTHPVMAFQAAQEVMDYFESDMTNMDILKMLGTFPDIYKYEIEEHSVPEDGTYTSQNYVFVTDIPQNRKILQGWLY